MKRIVLTALSLAALSLGAAEMVLVPAGEFTMGNAKAKAADQKPAHKVKVSAFYIDKYEVTQKDYAEITGQNPSCFQGGDRPVERVRWTDAALYCNLRSKKEGLKPCYTPRTWECDFTADGYRLPTEAEWEMACRAGSKGEFYFNGKANDLTKYGWIRTNSRESTHPVGKKAPNAWGIYDMYGNVAEWCNDYYDANIYASGKNVDPTGAATGKKRVIRGGSWKDRPKSISSSARMADDPATADICQGYDNYGFRCVRRAAK